jgi:hypothetical protein
MNELFTAIRAQPNFSSGEGASEQTIATYEAALEITFPEDYRAWLKEFGWCMWMGCVVYGIAPDISSRDLILIRNADAADGTRNPALSVPIAYEHALLCHPHPEAGAVVPTRPRNRRYETFDDYLTAHLKPASKIRGRR